MGQRTEKKSLSIFMNGFLVGEWRFDGENTFNYSSSWLLQKESRPLSLSLPLAAIRYKGALVESYFDNLLPDSEEILQRLRSRYSLASKSAFSLLYEIGRDCIGAVQLLPPGIEPVNLKSIHGQVADDATIESLLKSRSGGLFRDMDTEDFRISLAGAQEKTAFLQYKGCWMVPEGATPTTHIFKLPLGKIGNGEIDLSTSVENEWLCTRILKRFGIDTVQCNIAHFKDTKVLIVKRFDRRLSEKGEWIIRLPQEDFCQVTGRPPVLKYENDGGPGIIDIMDILRGSHQSEKDRNTFFKVQILFFLLAATDGHAKNFSIFLLPGGRYQLTPVYDVLSLYPVLGDKAGEVHPKRAKMAMALKGEKKKIYHWDQICRRHWFATAKASGFPEETCSSILNEVLEELPRVVREVRREIPGDFPEEISNRILQGMIKAGERLV